MTYAYEYPRPCVTADALVFRLHIKHLQILLIKRNHYPYEGMWALPGGFVDIDEPLEDAAARELEEEAGINGIELKQLGAYGQPQRDPRTRIIAVAYYGFAPQGHTGICAGDDARDARWWPVSRLPKTAFDHDVIIRDALGAIRRDVCFGLGHCEMLAPEFSRGDFIALHSQIFGEEYDIKGFFDELLRRKVIRQVRGGRFRYRLNVEKR